MPIQLVAYMYMYFVQYSLQTFSYVLVINKETTQYRSCIESVADGYDFFHYQSLSYGQRKARLNSEDDYKNKNLH